MNDYRYFPIFRSLLFPLLVFGIPRNLFVLTASATLAVVVSFGQTWFLAVAAIMFITFNLLGRRDPYFFDIYMELAKLKEIYQ